MQHKFSPWLSIDEDPADEPEGGGGEITVSAEEFQALKAELENKSKALANSREFENKYRKVEKILGDTHPEKLLELREAQRKAEQFKELEEQARLAGRNEASEEYKPQIEQFSQRALDAEAKAQQVETRFELFESFTRNEGVGKKFKTFCNLASEYIERGKDGSLRVKDENGTEVIYRDPKDGDRVATPDDFMKMLIKGEDLSKYQFTDLETLQHMFEPFNKAMGANLPTQNGIPSNKPLHEMTQQERAKYAFKS